jgi:hypothetical protein
MFPKDRQLSFNNRAQSAAGRGVEVIVSIMVTGLLAAYLLPVAIDDIVAVDTTGWSSGAQSLWAIMDLVLVLAMFLFLVGVALRQS